MKIPFFNYQKLFDEHKESFVSIFQDVASRGAFIMQKDLESFEQNLAQYTGAKHAIGVADGTIALVVSLRSMGIGPGDEVIVPSHTFVASAASIVHAGGKPVLADCGSDHLITADSIRKKITKRTKAIMPVQLNGRVAEMDKIIQLAEEHDLVIVEDAAQALGAKYKGKMAGTFGKAGTISFYPSKTLGCFGDGGAVLTNDDVVADYVKVLRDHGRSGSEGVITWGYNARLDNLQAAILDFKLKHYNEAIDKRRYLANIYNEHLAHMCEVLLPPGPDEDENHYDIYQNYEIEAEQRDDLREFLSKKGVSTILQWGGSCIHQFQKLGFSEDLPYTDQMSKKFMLLPMHTGLLDEEVAYVCDSIKKFYGK